MSDAPSTVTPSERFPGADCVKIFGTFRIARQPGKILVALLGLVATLIWGSLLDLIWTGAKKGVDPEVITAYSIARYMESGFEEGKGDAGIYEVYSRHLRGRVSTIVGSVTPSGGTVIEIGGMCRATSWMLRCHPWFSLLFFPGLLLIWACAGGMICRMAAVDFARGETISPRESFAFVRRHYWGGFLLAPIAPVIGIVFIGLLLVLGGLVLAIPYFGDILGGLFFFLALIGGLAIAVLWVGWFAGGVLSWPAVAVEGSSCFDAFATGFHYVYTRPWRAAFYGFVAFVYGAVCWLVVHFFAHLTLLATHKCVGIGAAAASRTVGDDKVAKLDAIWPYEFLGRAFPEVTWHGGDWISGLLIFIWVCLVIGLVWSFLVSYFFSAGTAIYFLLRRAVDLTDYEQIEEIEEYVHEAPPPAGEAPAAAPPPAGETTREASPAAEPPAPPPASTGEDSQSGPSESPE